MTNKNFSEAKEDLRQLTAELRADIKTLTAYMDEIEKQMEKWTTSEEAEEWFNNHDVESELEHIELF